MRKEYIKKSSKCRMMIERIINNKTVAIGPFMSAIKYVLEMKLGVPCSVYNTEYGELDFLVRAIRFKLQWPPKDQTFKLVCKHLEGDKFVTTAFDPSSDDPFVNLLETIETSINNVTPFDNDS